MLREWGSFIPAVKWLREDPHGSSSTREEVPEGGGGAPQPSGAVQRAAADSPRSGAAVLARRAGFSTMSWHPRC
ncbi:hypothetical protein AV530_013230 [Patagioenas fasciata monilis]|uniref:Uncharacterized protein n=1 Tax=Patagioenas fasciata monilis TaxID=372326 RepID=A0A1V4JNM0_PATFA|nr:hypothetical protein AV530_013230 [Patagioenas fasciata monilis]